MPTLSGLLAGFHPVQGLALPESWLQGRTAYGGLSTALGVVAAMRAQPEPLPPLRSAQVSFIAPAAGQLRFAPQLLRAGKSVTTMAVDISSDAGLAVRLALVFGQGRESALDRQSSCFPSVRPWHECREFEMSRAPFAPAFTANFQMRPAGGAMPLSAAEDAELLIWVRHRDASGVDPAVALVAMADALPPAVFAALKAPAPASSINWNFDLLESAPQGDWFLLRSATTHVRDGYSLQDMQVWNEHGRLVMRGQQSVAVFA